jgi:hypothetical protein
VVLFLPSPWRVHLFSTSGLFSPTALTVLRNLPVTKLSLSSYSPPNSGPDTPDSKAEPISDLLAVFALPNSFHFLTTLNLSTLPLDPFDLLHLRDLPLLRLNLNGTGATLAGLAFLTAVQATLVSLHVAGNRGIDDHCIPLLSLFTKLESLDLHGTSTTVRGTRMLIARARIAQPFLKQVSPPSKVRDWLVSFSS